MRVETQTQGECAVSYTHLDVYKRQHRGTIMNIWENLQIYKHKTQNKLIPGQIQINTKHDTIFKALNIENTQKTNTHTTITHNKTNLKYQKPTRCV